VKFRDEDSSHYLNRIESTASRLRTFAVDSRPSDHYFRSVSWFVCLFVCLFVQTAEFFSAVFDPISIKLGHILYVWV